MAEVEIVAHDLDHSFGERRVLEDISLTVSSGDRLGVVGESGSGKTTLARLLVGILPCPRVSVNGRPWTAVKRTSELRHRVQLIQQDPYASLTPHLSALGAVTEAVSVTRNLNHRISRDLATDLLTSVGIGRELAARRPRELSGGQCQRVAIARALAPDPSIIFADEPTSALDLSVQAQIINLLLTLMRDRGIALVMVSHDLAVIRHLTDRVVVLSGGRIVEQGPTLQVLGEPEHPYTRQLVEAAPRSDRTG